MPKANLLKNITINWISLVAAGANRREFLAKDGNSVRFECRVRKVDEEKRQVTGVLYPVGEVDTQGDFTTEAELDAAMLDFASKGRVAAGKAGDVNHDEQATGDYFPEVWKIREGDPLFPDDVGAWAVTRQIVDDARWEAVKSGEFNAFSFGGTALRVFDAEVTKAAGHTVLLRQLVALAKGPLADALARREIPNLLEALWDALWDAYYKSDRDGEKPALLAVLDEATPYLEKSDTALLKRFTKEEKTVDKTMDKKGFREAVAELLEKFMPGGSDKPSAPVDATAAVEAAKAELTAEHTKAVEALNSEHAVAMKALQEQIDELKKATPGSARVEVTDPAGVQKVGGSFCGYTDAA